MKYLPLPSQEELSRLFTYDEATGELRWKIKPNRRDAVGTIAGATSPRGYKHVTINYKIYLQHRVVFKMLNGYDPPDQVDHRNSLDKGANDRENLRAATHTQNSYNRFGFAKSGFKGVMRTKHGRYAAYFTYDGKKTYLGTYATGEEAHEQYAIMAELFHGEFANTEHRNDA